jgi:hypothetical protein
LLIGWWVGGGLVLFTFPLDLPRFSQLCWLILPFFRKRE